MSSLANLFKMDSPQRRREALCAHFVSLGINAQVANRGRGEEQLRASGENSLGIIAVHNSPISWIHLVQGMLKQGRSWEQMFSRTLGESYHRIWYGVRDANLRVGKQPVVFHSIRVRSVPVIGRATDVRWETMTEEVSLGPLSEDSAFKEPLLKAGLDVDVMGFSDGYWIIANRETGRLPNKPIWNAYEAVARGLIQFSRQSPNGLN
ncbi:MAG: hypothetical protein FJ320_01605 [SAR202 cluster bacterium]|nr:hypothetical protein [SAR202 cluster bacterium]